MRAVEGVGEEAGDDELAAEHVGLAGEAQLAQLGDEGFVQGLAAKHALRLGRDDGVEAVDLGEAGVAGAGLSELLEGHELEGGLVGELASAVGLGEAALGGAHVSFPLGGAPIAVGLGEAAEALGEGERLVPATAERDVGAAPLVDDEGEAVPLLLGEALGGAGLGEGGVEGREVVADGDANGEGRGLGAELEGGEVWERASRPLGWERDQERRTRE